MNSVRGTTGYCTSVKQFIKATEEVDFAELHEPFLHLIPTRPCRILDVGAGVGRDASVMASMGHEVVAVEPLLEFRTAGMSLHTLTAIRWLDDSLPELRTLGNDIEHFDFILASGVWHHINETERLTAFSRIFSLMNPGGVFALSLRHGPAGAGTHVFPTDSERTVNTAENTGFKSIVSALDLPSLIPGKVGVTWSKLAFEKPEVTY